MNHSPCWTNLWIANMLPRLNAIWMQARGFERAVPVKLHLQVQKEHVTNSVFLFNNHSYEARYRINTHKHKISLECVHEPRQKHNTSVHMHTHLLSISLAYDEDTQLYVYKVYIPEYTCMRMNACCWSLLYTL